jgi:hypothetical protein
MLGHASWHAYRGTRSMRRDLPKNATNPGASSWTALMFGYTEEQIAGFGLTFGVGGFMLYMLFIIGHLAWESKAGKFGTFVLFLGWPLAWWALWPSP